MFINNSNKKNLGDIASSISQSTFNTNIFNNLNNINTSSIPIDSRYFFSTINLSKKVPLTKIKNFNPLSSAQDLYSNQNNISGKRLTKNNSAFSIYNDYTSKLNREKREIETYNKKNIESSSLINNNKNITNIYIDDIRKKSFEAINVKLQMMKHYLRKQREKMNRTKFKFFRIVKNNNKKECAYFKTKNDSFNERLQHYFKSDYFYKINKEYHNQFHFGKNFLNMGGDITKHYMEINSPEKRIKLNSDLVLSLLNDEDKKMIYSDPHFFLRDDKYLYKLTKTKVQSLANRFKEENSNGKEDESEDDDLDIEKYYKNTKKISIKKHQIMRNIKKFPKSKTLKEGIPILDSKYINKKINEDLNKKFKNLKQDKSPVEKEMIQVVKKLNTFKKNDWITQANAKYYKSFHFKTREDFFKPYSLGKNRERLIKEKLFCKEMSKKNFNEDKDQEIIISYQRQLEDYYRKINSNKRFKKNISNSSS